MREEKRMTKARGRRGKGWKMEAGRVRWARGIGGVKGMKEDGR